MATNDPSQVPPATNDPLLGEDKPFGRSTCRTKSFQCIQVQKYIGRVAELRYLQVVETKVMCMFCPAERSSLQKAPSKVFLSWAPGDIYPMVDKF